MACHEILIVEDDEGIRDILKELLEIEGFRVSTAEHGREGLQRLEEMRSPCLILLDMMMPVMNGWEFLEVLQRQHGHVLATIPVAVVSAGADLGNIEKQYRCRIMKKPVDIGRLVTLAHEHCAICR